MLLDWTPAHFPTDEHGLIYFDGTHLYEHADPRQGMHAEWGSAIFNYGRNEVRSFLVSNANFWLDRYHIDGLRVDAVASMLYLDYARRPGEWVPNRYGGNENLEAIDFIRICNESIYREHPDTQTIAEESTAWAGVSRPTYTGGLGFGMKWDMGWMHDTLAYFKEDPIGRRYHHHKLTFRSMYFWSENYVLPLSHDEVVHGKGSLIEKMHGDLWQRFANLRLRLRLAVGAAGEEAAVSGGRDRPVRRVVARSQRRLAPARRVVAPRPADGAGVGAQSSLQDRAGPARPRRGTGGVRLDRRQRRRQQRLRVHAQGAQRRRRDRRRVQLHPGPASRLPRRRPRRRRLERGDEHRRADLRRQRHREPGHGDRGRLPLPRTARLAAPDAASAGGDVLQARAGKSRAQIDGLDPGDYTVGHGTPPTTTRSFTPAARAAPRTASCGPGSRTIQPAGAARRRCSRAGP